MSLFGSILHSYRSLALTTWSLPLWENSRGKIVLLIPRIYCSGKGWYRQSQAISLTPIHLSSLKKSREVLELFLWKFELLLFVGNCHSQCFPGTSRPRSTGAGGGSQALMEPVLKSICLLPKHRWVRPILCPLAYGVASHNSYRDMFVHRF